MSQDWTLHHMGVLREDSKLGLVADCQHSQIHRICLQSRPGNLTSLKT